jgi:hypothetical protein
MRVVIASIVLLAIYAVPQPAAAQTGTAPYCLQSPLLGTRCAYGTMGECENARGSTSSAQCITRTDAQGTTGLGESPARRGPSDQTYSPAPLAPPPR